MDVSDSQIATLFLERARYFLATEYRTKLRLAVEALPPGKLWLRPNESSNSAGNLLLHMMGATRQWIVSGVGGVPDTRHRAAEFAAHDGAPPAELLLEIDRMFADVDRVLSTVTPAMLLERRVIQGRDVTIFDAILGVVQHVSHHVGQIIWIAKLHAPGTINFVEDTGSGLTRPLWQDKIQPL